MDERQKAELHKRIVDFLGGNGIWVRFEDIHDYAERREHLNACGLDYPACTWHDDTWIGGEDTFNPGHDVNGLVLHVTCRCGLIDGRPLRYSGSHAELISGITGYE